MSAIGRFTKAVRGAKEYKVEIRPGNRLVRCIVCGELPEAILFLQERERDASCGVYWSDETLCPECAWLIVERAVIELEVERARSRASEWPDTSG